MSVAVGPMATVWARWVTGVRSGEDGVDLTLNPMRALSMSADFASVSLSLDSLVLACRADIHAMMVRGRNNLVEALTLIILVVVKRWQCHLTKAQLGARP